MDIFKCARCELEEPDTDALIIEPWETGDVTVHYNPNICLDKLKSRLKKEGRSEEVVKALVEENRRLRQSVNEDKHLECDYCGISDQTVTWVEATTGGEFIAPAHDNPYKCILALRGRLMAYVLNTTDDKGREID